MDETIESILYECGSCCILNDEKITPSLFETVENRKDFFITFFEIAKYNLMVFFPRASIK